MKDVFELKNEKSSFSVFTVHAEYGGLVSV